MIRRPPRSTLDRSSAASDVYKRQLVRIAGTGHRQRSRRERRTPGCQARRLTRPGLGEGRGIATVTARNTATVTGDGVWIFGVTDWEPDVVTSHSRNHRKRGRSDGLIFQSAAPGAPGFPELRAHRDRDTLTQRNRAVARWYCTRRAGGASSRRRIAATAYSTTPSV